MPSTAIKKRAALAAALIVTCSISLAGDQPPRHIVEPILGLRLDAAAAKLEPLPADVSVLCAHDTDNWIYHEQILARSQAAATTYYVVAGYAQRRNPKTGQSRYEPIEHGGLYAVTGNACVDDPADESFAARDANRTPLPVLQQLADDLASRLARAAGGADKLRTQVRKQRIDFDKLSPELQASFKPYFGPQK